MSFVFSAYMILTFLLKNDLARNKIQDYLQKKMSIFYFLHGRAAALLHNPEILTSEWLLAPFVVASASQARLKRGLQNVGRLRISLDSIPSSRYAPGSCICRVRRPPSQVQSRISQRSSAGPNTARRMQLSPGETSTFITLVPAHGLYRFSAFWLRSSVVMSSRSVVM